MTNVRTRVGTGLVVLAGAVAVLALVAGPAGAQTSGGAVATNGSVASGDAHANNNSTASGDATAANNSTASGCSTAINNSTASGGDCGPPTPPPTRVAVVTGGGAGGGGTSGGGGTTTARPAATTGRLAVTGDWSAELAMAAAGCVVLGGLLLAAGSGRRGPASA